MSQIKIKQSPIHGLGVFADAAIKKNTKIADYIGEEMSWSTFKSRYGPYKENSLNTYPMRRVHRIIVAKEEPYKTENVVNYINETDKDTPPNVCLKKKALYAERDIQDGEELLLQYPKDYKREWIL